MVEDEKTIGQEDSVLLERYTDEREFIENLRIRYEANAIYVSEKRQYFESGRVSATFLRLSTADLHRHHNSHKHEPAEED